MLEIIVASAIAFFVLDPIVVSIYDASRPYNYDADRLMLVKVRPLSKFNLDYKPWNPSYDLEQFLYQIIPRLADLPEVEKAIPLPERGFGGGLDSDDRVLLPDSSSVKSFRATFIPGEFFTTFGFKAASDIPGNPTIEQMDQMNVDFTREAIVTRTTARLLYGDEYIAMAASRAHQDTLSWPKDNLGGQWIESCRIVGILEDARAWGDRPWPLLHFYSDPLAHSLRWNETGVINIALRLRKGESPKAFARRFNTDPDLQALCRMGILEFDSAVPYSTINGSDSVLSPKERYRNVLVIFLAINIFLGVFGSFWMLTGKRAEEMGILRAFGATAGAIRRMLYVEGAIMALFSSIIGCGIYVFYLSRHPESFEYGLGAQPALENTQFPAELATWVGNFWQHSLIVSAVVCTLMLIVVLAGILIPAYRLSRINPVDALRDE